MLGRRSWKLKTCFIVLNTPENQYEQLLQHYSRPIILNHTNPYELQQLGLLSQTQIQAFFQHLKTYGKLISIYELQIIEGFDRATIYSLLLLSKLSGMTILSIVIPF